VEAALRQAHEKLHFRIDPLWPLGTASETSPG